MTFMQKSSIPNLLTYARVLAVPLLIIAFLVPSTPVLVWLPFILFIFASITDFLDGYLARKWNVESDIGRALDPIADKLLVLIAMVLLVATGVIEGMAVVAVCVILFREVWVSGLREALAGREAVLHVSNLGKWKTATQMVALGLLLLPASFVSGTWLFEGGLMLLWIAAALTLMSGWSYTKAAFKALR